MYRIHEGNENYVDEEYEKAVEKYTLALKELPTNAWVYAARAQAHLQLENYMDAAEDAGKAIDIEPNMTKAYLRKGIALFNCEEYESARTFFIKGSELDPSHQMFQIWMRKCDAEIAEEMESEKTEDPQPSPIPAAAPVVAIKEEKLVRREEEPSSVSVSDVGKSEPIAPAAPEPDERKYRHQWYETQTHVNVSVFAKKMRSECVEITMEEEKCVVRTKSDSGEYDYELSLQLRAEIVPDESKCEILSTKIEVKLKKAHPRTWGSLERDETPAEVETAERPAYPSSYKRKVVDWNRLEQEAKTEEEEEQLEGDAAVQKLFRQIYAGADEDTRRAMNKSFQESNGTVLSTNWTEVGSKKVECTPPTGMESKKY